MKKVLLSVFLGLISSSFYAQTYCTPAFASGCADGDQINSFEIPSASFSHLNTGCSTGAYGDFTSQTINMNAGVNYPFSVTHDFGSQNVKIWIDFNNDGTFDDTAPELVATASSVDVNGVDTSNGNIAIPATVTPGTYRMRVGDRYSSSPIPCNIDGYGEAHDYTVVIGAAPSCLAPSALTTSNVTATTANLSWMAPTSSVGVGYEYYRSTSSATPLSTTAATGFVANPAVTTPFTNLSPNTMYYVWVRSVCSGTSKSDWSSSISFTTLCGVVTPNFTFDFTSFPNSCWAQASDGNASTGPTGVDEYWYDGDFLNSGSNSAVINLYDQDRIGWLKTVPFNLSAGGYRVKFDYGITEYFDTISSVMGSDDVVQFLISENGGTTWTVLQTWNAANAPSNVSTPYSLDLTTYIGANTIFAFYGSDGTVDDSEDYEFFVDNFVVESINLSTSEASQVKNNIKAYPNPFADVLNISDVTNVKSVSVIDIAGRLVKTIEKPSSALHLGELKSGMYMVVLNMNDGSKQTIKAIKK